MSFLPRVSPAFLLALLAPLSLFGAACHKKGPEGTTHDGVDGGVSSDAPPPVVISAADSGAPPPADAPDGGLGRPPTATSWSIAGSNLDAEIADRTKRDDARPEQRLYLIELLLERGQFTGNVADYELAESIAVKGLKSAPTDPTSHFARALTLGAFHRFDDELAELDKSATHADRTLAPRLAGTRAGAFIALGRYDEAEKLMPPVEQVNPQHQQAPLALTSAAALAGRMQKVDESEKLFKRARESLIDVAPFPPAWMDFEHGLLLESRGKESEARLYYLEALVLIPVYVHAAVHAATGDTPEQAITRLEELRKVSTDPDVLGALADAYKKAKKEKEAKEIGDLAKARYAELVSKHPEAYRDHAARFWLGFGNDPKKALDYAEKNAALRPTEEAIDLWMGAAAAANKKDAVCKSAAAMSKLRWASEPRKRLAAAAISGCPDASAK